MKIFSKLGSFDTFSTISVVKELHIYLPVVVSALNYSLKWISTAFHHIEQSFSVTPLLWDVPRMNYQLDFLMIVIIFLHISQVNATMLLEIFLLHLQQQLQSLPQMQPFSRAPHRCLPQVSQVTTPPIQPSTNSSTRAIHQMLSTAFFIGSARMEAQ